MVEFRFYKVKGNDSATFVDKVIAFFTGSKYSHVEMVDSGLTLSVSPRTSGLVFYNRKYNEAHWDVLKVEYVDIDSTLDYILKRNYSTEYDYFGAIFSAIPFSHWFSNNNKLFCSEVGAMVMGYENPGSYSPGRLYRRIKDELYK